MYTYDLLIEPTPAFELLRGVTLLWYVTHTSDESSPICLQWPVMLVCNLLLTTWRFYVTWFPHLFHHIFWEILSYLFQDGNNISRKISFWESPAFSYFHLSFLIKRKTKNMRGRKQKLWEHVLGKRNFSASKKIFVPSITKKLWMKFLPKKSLPRHFFSSKKTLAPSFFCQKIVFAPSLFLAKKKCLPLGNGRILALYDFHASKFSASVTSTPTSVPLLLYHFWGPV